MLAACSLASGVVFGFALEKAAVYQPAAITNQMLMREFRMMKVRGLGLGVAPPPIAPLLIPHHNLTHLPNHHQMFVSAISAGSCPQTHQR